MPTIVPIANPSLFILLLLKVRVMPRPVEILKARFRKRAGVSHNACCLCIPQNSLGRENRLLPSNQAAIF